MESSQPTTHEHSENGDIQSCEGETKRNPVSNERAALLGEDETASDDSSLGYKILKTVVIFWLYLAAGASVEVVGPILPELVVQTNSSYESVMRSISMRGVGFIVGAVLAGLSVDRWFEYIDIIVAAATSLYSATGVGMGYVTNIDVLFVMFLLQGVLEQAQVTGSLRIILRLWKKNSSIGLNAIYLGNSIGKILTPKVTGLFVESKFSGPNAFQTAASKHVGDCPNMSNLTSILDSTFSPKYPANFVNALWIIAAVNLVPAVIFIAYFAHKQQHGLQYQTAGRGEVKDSGSMKKSTSSLSPKACSPTKPVIALLILISVFFYYGVFIPIFRIFPKMIFSYARVEACFSVEDSTSLQLTFFILVLVGRFVAFLLSSHVHPRYIMQVSAVGLVGSFVALYVCDGNTTALWIGVAFIGVSVANMEPGLFGLLNHYIDMTSLAMIVPMVGGAIGDVVVMYFLGPDYEANVGPKVLWTYMLILSVLLALSVILLQVLLYIHGDRYHNKECKTDD